MADTLCVTCGDTLEDAAFCVVPACPHKQASSHSVVDQATGAWGKPVSLPRADLGRRLGGSGMEFLVLFGLEVASAVFVPVGVVLSLLAAGYFAAKDLGGGRYSLGKRIARTRVVDARTGAVPPPARLVLRNGPLAAGFLFSVIPGLEILGWGLLLFGTTLDLLMIVADPQGRRLGDRLAGTQVVPVQDD